MARRGWLQRSLPRGVLENPSPVLAWPTGALHTDTAAARRTRAGMAGLGELPLVARRFEPRSDGRVAAASSGRGRDPPLRA